MLWDEGRSRNLARRREFARGEKRAYRNHGRGTSGNRCNDDGRRLLAQGAAIRFRSLAGLRSVRAATVRCVLRPLQADSKRRKQRTHQYDGHRRALVKSAPHVGSLPRKQLHRVIYITRRPRGRAMPAATSALYPRFRLRKAPPKDGGTFAAVSVKRNMNIGAREDGFSQGPITVPCIRLCPKVQSQRLHQAVTIRSRAVSALRSATAVMGDHGFVTVNDRPYRNCPGEIRHD